MQRYLYNSREIELINSYSLNNIGDAAIYDAIRQLVLNMPVAASEKSKKLFISVGGDIFNNARPALLTRTFFNNVKQLYSAAPSCVLFGQSLPLSCKGIALRLLCHALKRVPQVWVRDQHSHQRLQDAGVNAKLSYDLAFTLQPSLIAQNVAKQHFQDMGLQAERCALLSVREFDQMYPLDNKKFIQRCIRLCLLFQQRNITPILLVQSKAEGADNDLAIVKSIQAQLPNIAIINSFSHEKGVCHWQFLQALVATAGITVGVRFHSCVLAMAAGRLPFNLYYSNKGQDLSQRLDIPGCALDEFEPEQWIDAIMANANKPFKIKEISKQVTSDFHQALKQLEAV